jgi:hypothetical protein
MSGAPGTAAFVCAVLLAIIVAWVALTFLALAALAVMGREGPLMLGVAALATYYEVVHDD